MPKWGNTLRVDVHVPKAMRDTSGWLQHEYAQKPTILIFFDIFPRVFNLFTHIEATIFTIFGLRFLGLDDLYLALLGSILASSASLALP